MYCTIGFRLAEESGLTGNRKVAGSIPGSSQVSVEISLSKTPNPNGSR